jgi:hypothetical protein
LNLKFEPRLVQILGSIWGNYSIKLVVPCRAAHRRAMPAWAGASGCSSQQGTMARWRSGQTLCCGALGRSDDYAERHSGQDDVVAVRWTGLDEMRTWLGGSRRWRVTSKAADGGGTVLQGPGPCGGRRREGSAWGRRRDSTVLRAKDDEVAALRGRARRWRSTGGGCGRIKKTTKCWGGGRGVGAPGYIGGGPLVPVPATTRDQMVFWRAAAKMRLRPTSSPGWIK